MCFVKDVVHNILAFQLHLYLFYFTVASRYQGHPRVGYHFDLNSELTLIVKQFIKYSVRLELSFLDLNSKMAVLMGDHNC
jgi:hypothetical protein